MTPPSFFVCECVVLANLLKFHYKFFLIFFLYCVIAKTHRTIVVYMVVIGSDVK